jgi:hypothetical protein
MNPAASPRATWILPMMAALAFSGCGTARVIGDPCSSREQCPGVKDFRGECAQNQPNGYCTRGCQLDADCDSTSFCFATPFGQVCVRQCTRAEDCRISDGYNCVSAGAGRSYCGLPGT